MKTTLLSILGLVVIGGAACAGWYYYNTTTYAPESYVTISDTGTTTTTNTTTGEVTTGAPTFTASDVASHNGAASCYTIISGVVYDVTAFVNMHPGGKGAILSICGVDGTEKFMNKHHGGVKFMNILVRYKVGTLQ